jgi:amino-acid N-acetyltransferase
MPTTADIAIRRATVHDVPAMSKIVNDYAELGLMLHRSLATFYEHLRDFHVAVAPNDEQETGDIVVGLCGLNIIWANLAEVCALAVIPALQGQGIGKMLVRACIDEGRALSIRRLMTLTYERAFFAKLGFAVIDRENLPLKVWSECVRCAKNQACDEIAMVLVLEDVPEVKSPPPYIPPSDAYTVPVTLSSSIKPRPKMDEAH